MRDNERHIPLYIRCDQPAPIKRAKGGLVKHADKVKGAGRYGDDMLVHVNADEFEQLRKAWGEPTINPDTGLPEYFLSGLQKWFQQNPIASAVLPAAASILLPGIGGTIGSTINDAVGGALGSYSGAVGNGLLGAGLGALTGGGKGALIGGVAGAGTNLLQGALSGAGGLGSLFGGATSTSGSGGSGLRDSNITDSTGTTGGNSGGSSGSSGKGGLSFLGSLADPKNAILALTGAGAIASAFNKPKVDQNVATAKNANDAAMAQFNKPLPQVQFTRQRVQPTVDPTQWGLQGGQNYYANNQTPTVLANGGQPKRPQYPNYYEDPEPRPTITASDIAILSAALPKRGQAAPAINYRNEFNPADFASTQPSYDLSSVTEAIQARGMHAKGGQPRHPNTPAPDHAYSTEYMGGGQISPDYVEMGLGPSQGYPMVYGQSADRSQRVSPVQGMEARQNMGALEFLRSLAGDPDRAYKVQGDARDYPRYAGGGRPAPGPSGPPQGGLTAMRHVSGPGTGREDKIPAMLSDGEYVMDAELVSMLGDGSNKEGAKRLDQMRENVRAHKGQKLAKGKISPNAKPPHKYLPGAA